MSQLPPPHEPWRTPQYQQQPLYVAQAPQQPQPQYRQQPQYQQQPQYTPQYQPQVIPAYQPPRTADARQAPYNKLQRRQPQPRSVRSASDIGDVAIVILQKSQDYIPNRLRQTRAKQGGATPSRRAAPP